MTYQELWRSLVPTYDPREAQAIARWVLEVGMGMTTTDIYLGKVSELSADDHRKLEEIWIGDYVLSSYGTGAIHSRYRRILRTCLSSATGCADTQA